MAAKADRQPDQNETEPQKRAANDWDLPFERDELLRYVRSERQDSIGFDQDGEELFKARERNLRYYNGDVNDLPLLKNRSQAVSTDVRDAVETAFPDIMEVLFGGDDIVSFRPNGPEDIDKAEQETEAIRQIMIEENPGFMHFSHGIKDCLISRTGVMRVFWRDPEYDTQIREMNGAQIAEMEQDPSVEILEVVPMVPMQDMYKVEVELMTFPGMPQYEPWPSEDFAVSRDAVTLRDAVYCAGRSRLRRQELIADGYDATLVRQLNPYAASESEEIKNQRGDADEEDSDMVGVGDLAQVEVIYHCIRLLNPETEELQWYSVITGNDEAILLHAEELDYCPFIVFTPYLTAHRLFGLSLGDMMYEIQKVKTNLLRLLLDSGLFAINQRHEVAMERADDYTISDLLANIPGGPVRVRQPGAINPIRNGQLGFDVLAAMETVDQMGEKRSGVMRYGQGLRADTLHETASGALEQAAMMMKRVRMIARTIVESGVKDLALTLHKILRLHSSHAFQLRRGQEFIPLHPTEWQDRRDMAIEVGIGSGGRTQNIENRKILGDAMGAAVNYGEKLGVSIITEENFYNYFSGLAKDIGYKAPERFFTMPEESQGDNPPEMQAFMMQAKEMLDLAGEEIQRLQEENKELADKQQIEIQKIESKAQTDVYKTNKEAEIAVFTAKLEGMLEQLNGMQSDEPNLRDVRLGGEVG